ncbi:MAG: hypothetical protein WD059_02345 [Balneolaceae bacterium]
MKALTITASDVIREIKIWVASLIAAIAINVYAIILHNGAWSELYTQFHIVLLISIALYLFLVFVRAIILGVKALSKKIKMLKSQRNTEL